MRAKELLSAEDGSEIRRLRRSEKLPIETITRTLGVSRNTVRVAIAPDAPPRYQRRPSGSTVDACEEAFPEQLALVPTLPATVIAERVGWEHGITVFKVGSLCCGWRSCPEVSRTCQQIDEVVGVFRTRAFYEIALLHV